MEAIALVTASSGAIRCGTSRALEDALLARTRAALTLGDVSRAVSAYERLGWLPATTTKQRRAEVEKALLKAAPTRVPAATRVLATLPDIEAGVGPAWGPLMFTPFGSLLVRARGGLATVDVQTGTETAAQAIPSWPAAVTNLEGTLRWLGLYDPCDGVALRVRLGPPSEPPFVVPAGPAPPGVFDLPVPISPPLPGRCAPGAFARRFDAVPVAWAQAGARSVDGR